MSTGANGCGLVVAGAAVAVEAFAACLLGTVAERTSIGLGVDAGGGEMVFGGVTASTGTSSGNPGRSIGGLRQRLSRTVSLGDTLWT